MMRNALLCVLSGLTLALVGCAKSSEPPQRAETAQGGLMPVEEPGFEAAYVADQKEVKLATARDVSTEPLDTFRERNAEAAKAQEQADEARKVKRVEKAADAKKSPKAAKESDKPAEKATVAKKAPRSGKPGLFSRMKDAAIGKLAPAAGLVQGAGSGGKPAAAAKPGGKPAKAEPAKKQKKKEEAAAEEDEDDDAGKDEAAGTDDEDSSDEGGTKTDEDAEE
jgi:hypothetical protein